jgi:hypothetical protein
MVESGVAKAYEVRQASHFLGGYMIGTGGGQPEKLSNLEL